jgi:hypothetical protein
MNATAIRNIFLTAVFFAAGHLQATVIFSSNSSAADPTQFNSNVLGSTATQFSNVLVDPDPAWASAIPGSNWISFVNTTNPNAPNYFQVPDGTVWAFYQDFTLTAADTTANGSLSFLADDSASVLLNGHVLVSEASSAGNTYAHCSDVVPNCTAVDTIVLPASDFVTGVNVLEFDVAQRAGTSFGVDYSGTAGVPEPATMGMMGLGLIAAGVLGRKKFLKK